RPLQERQLRAATARSLAQIDVSPTTRQVRRSKPRRTSMALPRHHHRHRPCLAHSADTSACLHPLDGPHSKSGALELLPSRVLPVPDCVALYLAARTMRRSARSLRFHLSRSGRERQDLESPAPILLREENPP